MKLRYVALAVIALHGLTARADDAPARLGIDRSGFDTQVRPQDDLFNAVNGQWLKDTPIPADKSSYGIFMMMRDRADERVHQIVEELAKAEAPTPGSNEAKIGTFYRSYLDTAAIDQASTKPLGPLLTQISAVRTRAELATLLGRLQGQVTTPLNVDVDADAKDPDTYSAGAWQDGLGLPTRAYYFDKGERFEKARAAYIEYLQTVLGLLGDEHAEQNARTVFAFEKQLAEAHWTPVANRDPVKTYNPLTLKQLQARAPGFDWAAYFKAASLARFDRISVGQPSYAKRFAQLAKTTPIPTWQLYLRARLINDSAPVLPQAFRDAHFAFHGKAIQGSEQQRPRWQQATASMNGALGEAVGQVYVARHFPPAYKARMSELVANLMAAFGQSIDGLSWMSPQTQLRAKDKLSKYTTKIGYPDTWRDYSKLEVREGDAYGNLLRAGRFAYERRVLRVGQRVDRREWGLTPQTVNAYYNPGANEIVFPAAILEPPFFDMTADDAANYGAIGAIIGHEISHGFDDQGSQYDGVGKLANWWTPADRQAFDKLGARLVAQYNGYEALPGQKVNGELTLGENIADVSGLQIAYKAYHASLGGKPAPVIEGMSGDQRFFFAWSQAWRTKVREARTLQLLSSDPHSPSAFRANGAAVNHDAFHDTFGTKQGDGMYRPSEERIRIW